MTDYLTAQEHQLLAVMFEKLSREVIPAEPVTDDKVQGSVFIPTVNQQTGD